MRLNMIIIIAVLFLFNSETKSQTIAGKAKTIVNINKTIYSVVYELTPRKVQRFINIDLNSNDTIDLQFETLVDLGSNNDRAGVYLSLNNSDVKICDFHFLPTPIIYNKGDTIFNDCDSLFNQALVISEYSSSNGQYPFSKDKLDTTYIGFQWKNNNITYEGWIKYGFRVGSTAQLDLFSIGCDKFIDIKTSIMTSQTEIEIEKEILKVYPNPIKDQELNINLQNSSETKYELKIFDQRGRIIFNNLDIYPNRREKIFLKKINRGIYYLILNGKSNVISRKIIVQ